MWTIRLLALTAPVLLLSMLWRHPAAPVAFALSTVLMAAALMRLGAQKSGGGRSTTAPDWVVGGLAAVLGTCLLGIIYYAGRSWTLWGFPAGAWLLLGGMWLLPLLWVSLGYAWTFRRFGLSEDDLQRVRQAARPAPGGTSRDAPVNGAAAEASDRGIQATGGEES